jgi:putative phosphonate metabolism protein
MIDSPSSTAWSESARFAIYAAPPVGDALAQFGSAWLGRDAETGEALAPPSVLGLTPIRWNELTRQARHYGFHGTFKAPFELATGTTFTQLTDALANFAAGQPVIAALPLKLAQIAGFLALIPSADSAILDDLASGCVETFDPFRRPENAAQVAKRKSGLTPRQSALLERWGYPYVFEEYRFHMTLTYPVPAEEAVWLMRELAALAQPALARPLRIDALCLFVQADRHAPFRLIQRFPLAG